MSEKPRPKRTVTAPAERIYAPEESPTPAPVSRKGRARAHSNAAAAAERRVLPALWSGVKLLSGVLIVVAASVAVAWGAHRYALTTPRFAIQRIDLRGGRRIDEGSIAGLAGIKAGQNIFALDTDAAERRLLADPWVKEVKITRQLPSTLRVELSEREAAAMASIGGHLYLVTRSGEPFKQLESGDPFDLPVITGISGQNMARDRKREIERIALGLDVLKNYERVPMSHVHPAQEVHVAAGGDATLVVGKSAIVLELGHGSWHKKLVMAAHVVARLAAKGRTPGIVFLDNESRPDRVVVRMR